MSSYPDDRFDGERTDPRLLDRARGMVGAPALLLVVSGLIGLFVTAACSIPLVFDQDMIVRAFKSVVEGQPQGQQKKDMEQQVEKMENQINQNRDALAIEHAIELGIVAFLNLLAIVGGISMRGLRSYGLSMLGAVVSLIPCVVACCPLVGVPVGLWALVVLVRPEVKAAFRAHRSAPPPNPDEHYMR